MSTTLDLTRPGGSGSAMALVGVDSGALRTGADSPRCDPPAYALSLSTVEPGTGRASSVPICSDRGPGPRGDRGRVRQGTDCQGFYDQYVQRCSGQPAQRSAEGFDRQ